MPPGQLLILTPEAIFAKPFFIWFCLIVLAPVFTLGQIADDPAKMITEGDRYYCRDIKIAVAATFDIESSKQGSLNIFIKNSKIFCLFLRMNNGLFDRYCQNLMHELLRK